MLVAAALVPDTALTVPGVAGAAAPARALASAADEAVRAATAGVDLVVVVAPGPVDRELAGPVTGTLAPAGVPDRLLPGPVPTIVARTDASHDFPTLVAQAATPDDLPTSAAPPAPGTAAAIHLLAAAGHGSARLVEVAPHATPEHRTDRLRELGRALAAAAQRTALVVVGSGSGRHGPDAPLADDDRAPEHDARVLADLSDAGPDARARLAADDATTAAALAVTGWAPWQVLLGAATGTTVDATLLHDEVLAGAQHAVLLWRTA